MNYNNIKRFKILVIDDEQATSIGRVLSYYLNPFPKGSTAAYNLADFNSDADLYWMAEVRLCDTLIRFNKDRKKTMLYGTRNDLRDDEDKWDIVITDFHLKRSNIDGPWILLFSQKLSPTPLIFINSTTPEVELYVYQKTRSMKTTFPDTLHELFDNQIKSYEKSNIHQTIPKIIQQGLNRIRMQIFPVIGNKLKEFQSICNEFLGILKNTNEMSSFTYGIDNIIKQADQLFNCDSQNLSDNNRYENKILQSVKDIKNSMIYEIFHSFINFTFEKNGWSFKTLFPLEYVQLMKYRLFQALYLIMSEKFDNFTNSLLNIYSLKTLDQCSLSDYQTLEDYSTIIKEILMQTGKTRSSEMARIFFRSGLTCLCHSLRPDDYMKEYISEDALKKNDRLIIAEECFKHVRLMLKSWDKKDSFAEELLDIISCHQKAVMNDLKDQNKLNKSQRYLEFQKNVKSFRSKYLPESEFKTFIKETLKDGNVSIDLKNIPFPEIDQLKHIWDVFKANLFHAKNEKNAEPKINVIACKKDHIARLIFANNGTPIDQNFTYALSPPFENQTGYKLSNIAYIFQPFGRFIIQSISPVSEKEYALWSFDVFSQQEELEKIKIVPHYFIYKEPEIIQGTAYIFEINTYYHDTELKRWKS
jgi:hypothetical protein